VVWCGKCCQKNKQVGTTRIGQGYEQKEMCAFMEQFVGGVGEVGLPVQVHRHHGHRR